MAVGKDRTARANSDDSTQLLLPHSQYNKRNDFSKKVFPNNPSLRSHIIDLARQPDSIFLDCEDFCKKLGIDYRRYRNYVKSLCFHPATKEKQP